MIYLSYRSDTSRDEPNLVSRRIIFVTRVPNILLFRFRSTLRDDILSTRLHNT